MQETAEDAAARYLRKAARAWDHGEHARNPAARVEYLKAASVFERIAASLYIGHASGQDRVSPRRKIGEF